MVVHDIHRPDVNGVAPKMQAIADILRDKCGDNAFVLRITCDDNLMSSIAIWGSFDAKETWVNGIYENSRYFRFVIEPAKGARYYEGGNVKVSLEAASYKLGAKFRASTTTPEKAVARILDWLGKTEATLEG